METYQSVVLGIIQGLTEFLPISSSGHLVIFQHLFGMEHPEIFFDICVHVGTLGAVVIFFRKELYGIVLTVIKYSARILTKKVSPGAAVSDHEMKMALLIIAGVVPTAVIGLLLDRIAVILFSSVVLTGSMLIMTGIVLWVTKMAECKNGDINTFTFRKAMVIGFVQGLAITPGISRSGSTIAVGMFLGLDRELSARYSFLMSIPAIVGATILSLKDVDALSGSQISIILPGVLAAFFVGYLALSLLVYIVKKGRLHMFAPYCWLAGIGAILMGILGS